MVLQDFITVRGAGKYKNLQLVNFEKVRTTLHHVRRPLTESYQVSETNMLAVECNKPKCVKLLVGSSTNGAGEEAVLRMQGILAKLALPPVRTQLR